MWFYLFIHARVHSFVRSFIPPLRKSTPAKTAVLIKVRKSAGNKALRKIRSSEGGPFQVERPTTENAWLCLVEVRQTGQGEDPVGMSGVGLRRGPIIL